MGQLLLVRHAQSEWNAEGRWQGWADPPLSALGRDQAQQGGARLQRTAEPFTRAVSSDLERARTTARIIVGVAGAPELAGRSPSVYEVAGLRELDVGAWSGLTRHQIASEWPEALAEWEAGTLDSAPGGEERTHFDHRVRTALIGVMADHRHERLLVVAHGGVVRSVGRWLGAAAGPVLHVAGFWLDHDGDRPSIAASVDLLGPHIPDDSGGAL